jgi:hypothetical protein
MVTKKLHYSVMAKNPSRGASCKRVVDSGYNPGMYCSADKYVDMNDSSARGRWPVVDFQVQACG